MRSCEHQALICSHAWTTLCWPAVCELQQLQQHTLCGCCNLQTCSSFALDRSRHGRRCWPTLTNMSCSQHRMRLVDHVATIRSGSSLSRVHGTASELAQQRRQTQVKGDLANVSELQRPRRPAQVPKVSKTRQVIWHMSSSWLSPVGVSFYTWVVRSKPGGCLGARV